MYYLPIVFSKHLSLRQTNLFSVKGTIYLIPVTLGDENFTHVIPLGVIDVIKRLRYFVVEEIRTARRYLRMIDKHFPIDESTFYVLNEHTNSNEDLSPLIKIALDGNDMGIMSEAGLPCIADPGSLMVKVAQNKGVRVQPLCGPSSIILALIASGFNGQHFTFNGYLPVDRNERASKLRELEKKANMGITQIFMETPYRNQRMLDSILNTCKNTTMLCVATDITLPTEDIRTLSIAEWKTHTPDIKDRPTIFVIR